MAQKSLQDLLKISLKLSDQEVREWSDNPEIIDPERQKWLKEAIDNVLQNSDTQVLKHCLDCLTQSSEEETNENSFENKTKALDEIHNLLDLDSIATDFHLMGGLQIAADYLRSSYSSLRWRAAEVIADTTQNKPVCQEAFAKSKGISQLVEILKTDDVDIVRVKAVYALSCVTRNCKNASDVFIDAGGVPALVFCLRSDCEKLRTKSAFMLMNIISEDESVVSNLALSEIIPVLISILKGKHDASHEHIAHLLSSLAVRSKETVLLCRSPEYGLKKLLLDKKLELSQNDEEAYESEIMYYSEISELCFTS